MRLTACLTLVLALMGCRTDKDVAGDDTSVGVADEDGDGYSGEDDCDDNDPAVNPGAEELCDGVDNNCDGEIDVNAVDAGTFYADADADGYGDDGALTQACEAPEGSVEVGGDCDDSDAAYNPGAAEDDCADPNDYNCDGSVGYADGDGDGFAACEECDDADAAINPAAQEVCDGLDNDCDGLTDDEDEDVQVDEGSSFYADADADGFGDPAVSMGACEVPEGYVADSGDCDDADAAINPDATEVCNNVDDDCDGLTDDADDSLDASTGDTFYSDIDGDGYGNPSNALQRCEAGSGEVSDNTDCDDGDAAVNPGATEVCNNTDDDCDGLTDDADDSLDGSSAVTWYADSDGDGYGDPSATDLACLTPLGYGSDSSDCDDSDAAVNPAATEVCNGVDDDCDGLTDDDDGSLDASTGSTYYADSDGDGYGDASSTSVACDAPSGAVSDSTDCDDAEATTYPGAAELCDGEDNDCDGSDDDGVLGSGAGCAADDCLTILGDQPSASDDTYYLDGPTVGPFEAYCDMSTDGGGWTLVASIVNDASIGGSHIRSWDSYDVWTDATTFGDISLRTQADFKSDAYSEIAGDDYLMITDEYSFGFYAVVGGMDFASMMDAQYDATTCNQTFQASGADYSDQLSADQAAALSFIVRPKDSNAACFPTTNENAILGHVIATCCWAGGAGNTPAGQSSWSVYDLSMPQLSRLTPEACTAGTYTCNDAGYRFTNGTYTYTYDSKVIYGELYVR